jgi:hypothetical protein
MVQPFSVPANIPKGTAVADGYRIAPTISTLSGTGVSTSGVLISGSSYNNYGPGMLQTPFNTWNITPYPTTVGNIVANNTVVPGARWLTLAGDGAATTLTPSSNPNKFPPGAPNNFYLQFDWPRVPQISLVGPNLGGAINVTFFGFDWYGQPLQHTYSIQAAGTYPGPLYNVAALKGKAFYQITGVYLNGVITNPNSISCQVSNTFGLPYVLKTYSDVNLFAWNNNDMKVQGGITQLQAGTVTVNTPVAQALYDANAIVLNAANNYQSYAPQVSLAYLGAATPTSIISASAFNRSTQAAIGNFTISSLNNTDIGKISWSIPNGGYYLVAIGDATSPSTQLTGDVRGLFELPYLTETWAKIPDGNTKAIFTYYCEGYDEWLSILNAGGQPQLNGVVNPGSNNIVPPNLTTDMFGVPQYYTGVAI